MSAIGASALAAMAAVVANVSGSGDIVPFFVTLTFAGGVLAWAAHEPFAGGRRLLARGLAILWLVVAVWVAVLLVLVLGSIASSPGPPEARVLGLPATVYHLTGLYGSATLAAVSGLGRDRWFRTALDEVPTGPNRRPRVS